LRRRAGAVELPAVDLIDDKEGKPIGTQTHIGRRPSALEANGNKPQKESTT
jgi:hypothetical protein